LEVSASAVPAIETVAATPAIAATIASLRFIVEE
jgi:hypothetical protein